MVKFLSLLLAGGCLGIPRADLHAADANGRQEESSAIFDVRRFGARGDGLTLDTAAIHRAVQACSKQGGGQVLFPPGRYLTGTIHLCSHLDLFLAPGASIIGTTNLSAYAAPEVPAFMPEAKWGKWH